MEPPPHVVDLTSLPSNDDDHHKRAHNDDDDDLIILPECPIHRYLAGRPSRKSKRSQTKVSVVSSNDNALRVLNSSSEARDNQSSKRPSSSLNNSVVDDDCCILDEDPSRVVGKCDNVDKYSEEEELVVIGQTGQVACRDYPHARFACAQFPFETTPHEAFCSQCYCYICDAPAPCATWGNGCGEHPQRNHCNAFDRGEAWDKLRKKAARKSKQSDSANVFNINNNMALVSRNETGLSTEWREAQHIDKSPSTQKKRPLKKIPLIEV